MKLKVFGLLFLVAVVLAIKFLPWWALIGVVVVGALGLKWGLKQLFLMPFKAKGAVLRGAGVEVHEVKRLPAPPTPATPAAQDSEEGEAEESPPQPRADLAWYEVDVTIAPKAGQETPFGLWEPGELRFTQPGADPLDTDADVGEVFDVRLHRDGTFVADEGGKYPGVQRVKLQVGVEPSASTVALRYYFEHLTELRLSA